MQKLPEVPDRKRDDTCTTKKEPSRQRKRPVLFQQ